MRAPFITFEGGEAAGKSTQIKFLQEMLESKGISVFVTREPGGNESAEKIREFLLHGDLGDLDGLTEVLLLSAARREHIIKTILPKLEAGTWVLCDRFVDSTYGYQGYAMGQDLKFLWTLYEGISQGLEPDVTFIMDVPLDVSLQRLKDRGNPVDRYEARGADFHQRVREGFLSIAEGDPKRCVVVDGTKSLDTVKQVIRDAILRRYPV
jgi:dTMP kinase